MEVSWGKVNKTPLFKVFKTVLKTLEYRDQKELPEDQLPVLLPTTLKSHLLSN